MIDVLIIPLTFNLTPTFTFLFTLIPNPILVPTHDLTLIFVQISNFFLLSLRIAWVEYSDSSYIPCSYCQNKRTSKKVYQVSEQTVRRE